MIAWTIAGSDSGGGAGIQADLKTFHSLGVHGCSVITALTAQNTRAVNLVEYPSAAMIEAQIETLAVDLPPKALKIGMLGNAAITRTVAAFLPGLQCFSVCDPVMLAASGASLMEPETKEAFIEHLLPVADLVTPNLPEAEALCGMSLDCEGGIPDAAARILAIGARSVLIKGGHGSGELSRDYWTDGREGFWLTGPRLPSKNTHGTGCTLSSAIAACIALGYELRDALVIAKSFVTQGIRQGRALGEGPGPVFQGGWPEDETDLPWLTAHADEGEDRPHFPTCGPEPLGFYPIVDRVSWLARLLPLGVTTVQLRIKDLEGAALAGEIREAIRLAREAGARLFINDYWRLAMEHGAYGVHLGQEDLAAADVRALAGAGLRLGVSTHCYGEVARALAVRPSYMAVGPIFPTTSKVMVFEPQGLANLRRWRRTLSYPLVAIGGISLERGPQVMAAGADGIAVITAVTKAVDPEAATRAWLALFRNHTR